MSETVANRRQGLVKGDENETLPDFAPDPRQANSILVEILDVIERRGREEVTLQIINPGMKRTPDALDVAVPLQQKHAPVLATLVIT
nr:hypothetical protein [Mesorhizobium sp. SARCC-RB16n]